MLSRICVIALFCILSINSALADYSRARQNFDILDIEKRWLLQWDLTWTGHYNALTDAEFGRRTYEAIRDFQAANGFPATGVLTGAQYTILSALADAERKLVGLEFVKDPRSGLELGVPTKIARIRENALRGTRWKSQDGRFVLESTSMPYFERSYIDLYNRLAHENPRRTVSYKTLKSDVFVVTGRYDDKSFYTRMYAMRTATKGITITWESDFSPEIDGVVLGLAATVFELKENDTQPTPSPSAIDQDRLHIVVASRSEINEAISLARDYAATFEHTGVYRSSNGHYAISIGTVERSQARDVLEKLLGLSAIPRDSFLSSGARFQVEIWSAEAINTASESAPSDPDENIKSEEPDIGAGSGFFISSDGVMLTNAHVAGDCDVIEVSGYGAAKIVKVDSTNDLALIKLNKPQTVSYAVFQMQPLRIGSDVVVLGYPLADVLASTLNVTFGEVTSLSGLGGDTRFFQLSAPIQHGNSGGPVLDSAGHVVGVATARLNDLKEFAERGSIPQNVNFALRGEAISAFLRSANAQFQIEESEEILSKVEIAEEGGKFTAQVWCVNR